MSPCGDDGVLALTTATAGTPCKKTNLSFTFECRNSVNVLSTPIGLKTCSGSTCTDSLQFQKRILKISHCGRFLQNTWNLVISRCCFAEDGKEMYQDSKRTCTVIVLLIKPFVWCRSRRRRRRGLLKLLIIKTQNRRPNNLQKTSPQSYKTQIKILPFPGLA